MKPRMFIASSSENLDLAYAAQEGLEHDVEATVWTQGVFAPSRTAVTSLLAALEGSDFGLFILSPDDVTSIRDKETQTVRDNVIFELGMFLGRLGAERCFLAVPKSAENLHLPTDLSGLTLLTFDPNRQDKNYVAALGPSCNRIRKVIAELQGKPRVTKKESKAGTTSTEMTSDPSDCTTLIESWMGSRSPRLNAQTIRYDDVDKELNLVPGSARLYIALAASRWDYKVVRRGKDFVLFQQEPLVLGRGRSGW